MASAVLRGKLVVQPHSPPRPTSHPPSISTPSSISLGPVKPIGLLRNFRQHVQKRPSPERPRGHRRRRLVENFSGTFQQAPTTCRHLDCDLDLLRYAMPGRQWVRQPTLDLSPPSMAACCAPSRPAARRSCRWRRRSLPFRSPLPSLATFH